MNSIRILTSLIGIVNLLVRVCVAEDGLPQTVENQDACSTKTEIVALQEITVIGSKDAERDLAGSGAYLDRRDISTHSYSDISRVLRKVPGVYLREEDGYGLFPNISLRGVDPGRSGKVTLMEDGILSAPAPYSAPSAYYSPTTGRMTGIEVLKGSSQIKYGPHTTGGVINYLSTPIPTTRRIYEKWSLGTDNEVRNHSIYGDTIDVSFGQLGFVLENYYRELDGFKEIDLQDDSQNTNDTGFRKHDSMVKFAFEPSTNLAQRVEFKVGYLDKKANETYLGLTDEDFELNPYRRYSASRFDNMKANHLRTYLRYTVAPASNLNVSIAGYYNEFHRNWFKLRGSGEDLLNPEKLEVWKGDSAGTLKYRNNNRDYLLCGLQSNASFRVATGGVEHEFDLGIRYHFDEVRRFQSNVDFEQDENGNVIGRMDKGPGSGGNRLQETTARAVFLQDRIEFGSLKMTPGIRFEHVKYSFTDFDTTGEPDKITREGESTMSLLAPGLGLNFAMNNRLSAFASAHRGFSVPGPRANAKSNLVEETSNGCEAGFRVNDNGLRAEMIGFYTDFDDLLVSDNVGGGGIEGKTENAGDIVSSGIEIGATYDPGFVHNLGFSIPSHMAFTFTNATLDGVANSLDDESIFAGGEDGHRVPYVPEIQLTAGTGIEFSKWAVFVTGTFVGETFTSASESSISISPDGTPNANYGMIDSYYVLDVSGKYNIGERHSAFINIHNLMNREYMVSRHPIGPRSGKPFSVMLGMEERF